MKSIHSFFGRIDLVFILLFLPISFDIQSQTHPKVQPIPFALTEYFTQNKPTIIAIHGFTEPQSTINIRNGNRDLPSGVTAWYPQKENGISFRGGGSGAEGYSGALLVAITTKDKSLIAVRWKYRLISQNPYRDNSMILQYRVGTSGVFTSVEATTYNSATLETGDSLECKIVLPAICNNKPLVQLRWFYWHSAGSSGLHDVVAVDDIYIKDGLGSIMLLSEPLSFKFQRGADVEARELVFSMVGTESKVQITTSSDFELSRDRLHFFPMLEIPPSLTEVVDTIWVRPISNQEIGEHSQTIYFSIYGAALATLSIQSTVLSPPPSSYPSGFRYSNVVSISGQDLNLHWVNPIVGVIPLSYLLVTNQPDFAPEDGVDYSQEHIVIAATLDRYSILEPKIGESYHFRLFPYTNLGDDILYKKDHNPPALTLSFDPLKGSKSLPYTIAEFHSSVEEGGFDLLWVRAFIVSQIDKQLILTDNEDLKDREPGTTLEVSYSQSPISTHVIAGTPLLICISRDQGLSDYTALSSVFEGVIVSVEDGLWEDRDIWLPGRPGVDSQVTVLHDVTITESIKVGTIRVAPVGKLIIANEVTLDIDDLILEISSITDSPIDNHGFIKPPRISIEREFEQPSVWYLISLPFDLYSDGVVGFQYSESPSLPSANSYYLRYYDSETRVLQQSDQNLWRAVSVGNDTDIPIMKANTGYLISLSAEAQSRKMVFRSRDTTRIHDPDISLPLIAYGASGEGLSIHNGWNLVANPYLTAYSMASSTDKSLVGAFAYKYDGATYQIVELGVESQPLIPPLAPFFVKAERSDNWVFPSNSPNAVASSAPIPEIKLIVSQGQWSDQLIIRLNPLSSNGYDPLLDAAKFLSMNTDVPQIFAIHQGGNWAIRTLPLEGLSQEIPLGLLLPEKGEYKIRATLSHTDHLESIYWHRGGSQIALNPVIEFAFTTKQNLEYEPVKLVVTKSLLDTLSLPKDRNILYLVQSRLYIYLPQEGASLSVFDLAGTLMIQKEYPKGGSTTLLSLSPGCYLFQLKQGRKSQTTKMMLF